MTKRSRKTTPTENETHRLRGFKGKYFPKVASEFYKFNESRGQIPRNKGGTAEKFVL